MKRKQTTRPSIGPKAVARRIKLEQSSVVLNQWVYVFTAEGDQELVDAIVDLRAMILRRLGKGVN
jgi:hypothetical protein